MLKLIFEAHFGIRAAQGGQEELKRAIRSCKEPTTFIFKNLQKPMDFRFLASEASQESLKKPKITPKRAPKKSKNPTNRDPKWTTTNIKKIGIIFEDHSETQTHQKKPKKNCF